jgi:hypothetical protein
MSLSLAILRNYPPVGDTALYGNPLKDATDAGALIEFRLSVVLRQAGDEHRPFRDLLKHARLLLAVSPSMTGGTFKPETTTSTHKVNERGRRKSLRESQLQERTNRVKRT